MKKAGLFFILILLTVLCISSHLSATTRGISVMSKQGQSLYLYDDYQALVVGVSNYEQWPKLPNAVNDAVEVAEKLGSMGIHVQLVLDPTYREMRTAITDMVYGMGSEMNRAVLFYYAGHGETEVLADGRKMGYIIPKDCPLLASDPRGFANHAISMREIESASMRIHSKHVLMLFDSCFSGALFALVRAVPHDITEKSALPVRQYITAGREDEEVPDQSMFKRCLLIGLEGDADLTGDGYITGSELGMYLSDKVVNYTNRQQHPQYGKINNPDLDRGDVVFSLNKSIASPQPTRPLPVSPESQRLAEERASLERERRELEELRSEIEKKQRESQGQKVEVAGIQQKPAYSNPTSSTSDVVERDGVYVAYANGIVKDTRTGLEWKAGPDRDMTWNEARSWVQSLNLDGGGWRMPTLNELKDLYWGEKNSHITDLLKTSGEFVWSGKTESSKDFWAFGFYTSHDYRTLTTTVFQKRGRAFAVRSRSGG